MELRGRGILDIEKPAISRGLTNKMLIFNRLQF